MYSGIPETWEKKKQVLYLHIFNLQSWLSLIASPPPSPQMMYRRYRRMNSVRNGWGRGVWIRKCGRKLRGVTRWSVPMHARTLSLSIYIYLSLYLHVFPFLARRELVCELVCDRTQQMSTQGQSKFILTGWFPCQIS